MPISGVDAHRQVEGWLSAIISGLSLFDCGECEGTSAPVAEG